MSALPNAGALAPGERSRAPSEAEMLDAAARLIANGVAVHWLHPRSKRPIGDDWAKQPVHTLETLRAAYRRGNNLGIRPGEFSHLAAGYLQLIDLDIREVAQAPDAWAALLTMWPEAREAPFVVSGSGGESRHLYFITDKPFRSRKLAKSSGFSMVYDPRLEREVKKHDWEIEIFGAPKQAVLPPSVHPDTGERYTWGREIDFDLIDFGLGPVVASAVVASWGAESDDLTTADDDEDDLMSILKAEPMGLSEDEIAATLGDLPEEWVEDRDFWLQAGAALHHEYQGGERGFERWCEWSKQSEKFDLKDSKAVWKSFGKNVRNPIRMATLIQAAGQTRLARDHAFLDDMDDGDEDVFDLLAPSAVPTPPAADTIDLLADLPASLPAPIKPGASVSRPPLEYDPDWRSYLQRNEEGGLKPTLHNVELIIRNDKRLRGVIAYNEFAQETVQIGVPRKFKLDKDSPKPIRQLEGATWNLRDPVNGDLWSDAHDADIRIVLEAPERQGGYGLKTSDRDLAGAVGKVARLLSFHPVRKYLSELRWDGKQRVATLFIDYVGAEDDAYHREAALLFALGAVTRVFEPGHKFDFVPILEGLQGKRKSTFIRILGRHWSSELEGDFNDTKGMVERMQGAWLLELAELSGFSKAEVQVIKSFISRQKDKVRLAYARRASEFQRQCVFLGSTNEIEYLRDASGGRRFWPIACAVSEIDTDRLSREVDQIWAEAKAIYDEWRSRSPHGELPLYMKNPVAAEQARQMQESRRELSSDDVLAGQIEAWLDQPVGDDLSFDPAAPNAPLRDEVCIAEIWTVMLNNTQRAISPTESRAIGRALSRLPDWRSVRTPRKTKRWGSVRVYRREMPLERSAI